MPAIFNNITVPLLGLSDTAISGHLGSEIYMGAMAVGAMMFNVIFLLCGFLRMGTTGLTAVASGAADSAMMRDVLRKSLIIAAAISGVALLLQRPLSGVLLSLISPAGEVRNLALEYYYAVIWSVPAQLAVMAVSGWYIGRGDTLTPMCISVGINILNIGASVSLVFGAGMGFTGVALGTLIANWVGAIIFFFLLRRGLRRLPPPVSGASPSEGAPGVRWSRFFAVNTNLFFRSACIMGVSLTMTSVGARIGDVTLAVNAVMMQFFLFFSYFMDGFAFAGESIVGNALGASDRLRLRAAVRALLGWGCVMAASFMIVYLAASGPITSLLTDTASVRLGVAGMRGWLVALPPVTVMAFIFDGIFIGMARTRPLLEVTLAATALFIAVLIIGSGSTLMSPNNILWLAFEAYLMLRGVLLAVRYLILQRKSLIL